MKSNIKKSNTGIKSSKSLIQDPSSSDPQIHAITPRRARRNHTPAYKKQILAAYESSNAEERGALLRREGLYCSHISMWRREKAYGKWEASPSQRRKSTPRIEHLTRENEQLKKKLAQAQAIIDLQKKVSELLGQHILPQKNGEENS